MFDQELTLLELMEQIDRSRFELMQKQFDLEKQKITLANIEKEKTDKVLEKQSDGKYKWVYKSNAKNLREAQETLSEMELKYAQYTNEQILVQKKQALDDEKRLYDDSQYYKKNKLDDEKRLWDEAVSTQRNKLDDERTIFEKHYADFDVMANNAFVNLRQTYNDNWQTILNDLTEKVDKAKKMYEKLLGYNIVGSSNATGGTSSSTTNVTAMSNVNTNNPYNFLKTPEQNATTNNTTTTSPFNVSSYIVNSAGKTTGLNSKLVGAFDSGGVLASGKMGVNLSGNDEYVLNPTLTDAFLNVINQMPRISNIFSGVLNGHAIPALSTASGSANNNDNSINIENVTVVAQNVDDFLQKFKKMVRGKG
jgi:hypothetical protein